MDAALTLVVVVAFLVFFLAGAAFGFAGALLYLRAEWAKARIVTQAVTTGLPPASDGPKEKVRVSVPQIHEVWVPTKEQREAAARVRTVLGSRGATE